MFFISGAAFSLLTFPGVILHEISHRILCDLLGVPVYDVCYFRYDKVAGYVLHEKVNSIGKSMLIAIAPLIINSLVCITLTTPAAFHLLGLSMRSTEINPLFIILAWIGLSAGAQAFPSNQDMHNFVDVTRQAKNRGVLYLIALPLAYLLKLINFLRKFWFDLYYAICLGCLPSFIYIHWYS